VACFYAQLGEIDKALDYLEGSVTSRSWLESDPELDPLRSHPRFQAYVETLED
jgi:adenylate cyclase